MPAAPWASHKHALSLRVRSISIDNGDFEFPNYGGPNIGAEILATLRAIEAVLFFAIAVSMVMR